jgi:hypothetical protein
MRVVELGTILIRVLAAGRFYLHARQITVGARTKTWLSLDIGLAIPDSKRTARTKLYEWRIPA